MGIMTWESLAVPAIFLFGFGLLLIILSMLFKDSRLEKGGFSATAFMAIIISVILLIGDAILLNVTLGLVVTQYDNVLVAILFAIYEETLFLGVIALIAGIGLPDVYNLFITSILFIPYHFLVYPQVLPFFIFLLIGRVILTGAILVTDNSDVGYGSHILYNLITTIGSVF